MTTVPVTVVPPQKPKPFYQSKSFWGSVLTVASVALHAFPVTAPFASLVTVVGAGLGIYGRAVAQGPLTLTDGSSN